jgi:hypothetical protein
MVDEPVIRGCPVQPAGARGILHGPIVSGFFTSCKETGQRGVSKIDGCIVDK